MTQSLNKLLTSFNLVQQVTSPTHVHGNTLDLIISPKTNKIVITIPSDHSSPTTSSYSLPLVDPNPTDPSIQDSHAKFTASTFLILYPIFLPFQPQRLLNYILLSSPPSINTPPYSLKPPSYALTHPRILYPY